MRTIGRHVPRKHRGDPVVECDYCGLVDYRSLMVRDASGLLACRLDQKGRDAVTLDEENALSAREASQRRAYRFEEGSLRPEGEGGLFAFSGGSGEGWGEGEWMSP